MSVYQYKCDKENCTFNLKSKYEEMVLRLAAKHKMEEHAVLCPECTAGKHANCVQVALDPESDEMVPCQCLVCDMDA